VATVYQKSFPERDSEDLLCVFVPLWLVKIYQVENFGSLASSDFR